MASTNKTAPATARVDASHFQTNDDKKNHNAAAEDDDDIIAIQEKHNDIHLFSLEERRRLSNASQPLVRQSTQQQSQPEYDQQKNGRRRRRVAAGTNHTAATTTRTFARKTGFPTSQEMQMEVSANTARIASNDFLNESNAFESLQSLLEQQPLSLSQTQEESPYRQQQQHDEGKHFTTEPEIGCLAQEENNPLHNRVFDGDPSKGKENSSNSSLQNQQNNDDNHNSNYIAKRSVPTGQAALEGRNKTTCDHQTEYHGIGLTSQHGPIFAQEDGGYSQGETQQEEHEPTFSQMMQDTSSDEDQPASSTLLKRELERQRRKMGKEVDQKKCPASLPAAKYYHQSTSSSSHSIRKQLEKQRRLQSAHRKTARSMSADKILQQSGHDRPSKRHGRARSTSPKRPCSKAPSQPRSSTLSPMKHQQPVPVEKANKSLLGFR